MKLNFLGRGASFYPQAGNNAAYFIDSDELFLIDCGEDVFGKLMGYGMFKGIKKVNLLVTHLHSDHIGSLGSLILFCHFALRNDLNIIIEEDLKYLEDLKRLVEIFGCTNEMVNYVLSKDLKGYQLFDEIKFVETYHCPTLDCYGIKFKKGDIVTYYSGDTRELCQARDILENEQVDYVYIDVNTSNAKERVHICIDEVLKLDPKYYSYIYCMHVNNQECIEKIQAAGLNLVEIA